MQMPSLLPVDLLHLEKIVSDKYLFETLSPDLSRLLLFFEYACEDETWSLLHPEFMEVSINRLTLQFFSEKMPFDLAKRAAAAIRPHFRVLNSFIPLNLTIELADGVVPVNSLLLGTSSRFFQDLVYRQCYLQEKKRLTLADTAMREFIPIKEFTEMGSCEDLWRYDPLELKELLKKAKSFDLQDFMLDIEDVLARYITQENVLEVLFQADHFVYERLKEAAVAALNKQEKGILFQSVPEGLRAHFKNFDSEAIELFKQLKHLIVFLKFDEYLFEDPSFQQVLQSCPHLLGVNLSETEKYSRGFAYLPRTLQQLNVANSPWVSKETLERLSKQCPELSRLVLSGNTHIDYQTLSVLRKMSNLKALELAFCTSLSDEELRLILEASPSLKELDLEGCAKLTDKSFFDISTLAKEIVFLGVSRTAISDASLIEIARKCKVLSAIDLSYCKKVSEWGVLQFVRHTPMLRIFKAKGLNISDETIRQMKSFKALLELYLG